MSATALSVEPTRFEQAQRHYRKRIKAVSQRNFRTLPGFDQQDLESEMLEVLWQCCNLYDPDNGACFNTFFWTCWNRKFLDLHKHASRKMRVGDYDRVWLDDEATRGVIENFLDASAEDEALARIHVQELARIRPSE